MIPCFSSRRQYSSAPRSTISSIKILVCTLSCGRTWLKSAIPSATKRACRWFSLRSVHLMPQRVKRGRGRLMPTQPHTRRHQCYRLRHHRAETTQPSYIYLSVKSSWGHDASFLFCEILSRCWTNLLPSTQWHLSTNPAKTHKIKRK